MAAKLLNGEPKIADEYKDIFDGRTWINPDFQYYKLNNDKALLAMYYIVYYDGRLDDPRFDTKIKELIEKGKFVNVDNGDILAGKLQQFQRAWGKIKQDQTLCTAVTTTLNTMFGLWPNYRQGFDIYETQDQIPVYFDVARYLVDLLDEDGEIKPDAVGKQDAYCDLARGWRAELGAHVERYNEYMKHGKKPDEADS